MLTYLSTGTVTHLFLAVGRGPCRVPMPRPSTPPGERLVFLLSLAGITVGAFVQAATGMGFLLVSAPLPGLWQPGALAVGTVLGVWLAPRVSAAGLRVVVLAISLVGGVSLVLGAL